MLSEISAEAGRCWLDGVVAAVLTPFTAQGVARPDDMAEYSVRTARTGVTGLAVGAHTGRGHVLPSSIHAALVGAARSAGLPVVATASLSEDGPAGSRGAVEHALLTRGEAAAAAGASAVLCMPPPARLDPDPAWVARLHRRLADVTGLPVIAFMLYADAADNITYGPEHLTALADVAGVDAVKIATLNDAIACQDAIRHLRQRASHVRVLTGEDRMFGPSLMWGATGALVGIAATRAHLSVDLVGSWHDQRLDDFLTASRRLDSFARLVFSDPIEGYVRRLGWTAQVDGILPASLCHDPVVSSSDAEREEFLHALDGLDGDVLVKARGGTHP